MIKRVEIELLEPITNKVLRRVRIHPPRSKDGHRQFFTANGVDAVLERFIERFDKANLGYRLVSLGKGRFRFVWRGEEDNDTSGD